MKAKRLFMMFAILASAITVAFAQSKPTEKLAKEVVPGKWQVISLKTEDGTKDYSKDSIIWTFSDDKIATVYGTGLPDIKDKYRIEQSIYRRNTILIFITELETKAGFTWPKFVVQAISKDKNTMWLGNWEDEFLYELKRVE